MSPNIGRILSAALLFLAAGSSLTADSLTITGTATSSDLAGINVGDTWTGTLTTNGTCLVCTPANGGLLGLSINMYGDIFSAPDVEGYPAFPSFDRTAGNLSLAASAGPDSDVIVIGPLAARSTLAVPRSAARREPSVCPALRVRSAHRTLRTSTARRSSQAPLSGSAAISPSRELAHRR
jgi:hypothetical protein